MRNLFPCYFVRKLVTRNYVLIIPEYEPHLILVAMLFTVYCLLLIMPRVAAVASERFSPLHCFIYACEKVWRVQCSRVGCIEASRQSWCTRISYAVQWYVNASVTRDLDNLMRLVCEHTTKNIKKAHHFFSLSCLLHHRNEIMTSVCIKNDYRVYEIL